MSTLIQALKRGFTVTVEVVPPQSPDPAPLLESLSTLQAHLQASLQASLQTSRYWGYSVATNPVAKPHMSALALSGFLRSRLEKPVILHCTTRDHNALSLQGLLWGAAALGIDTVLAATGDRIAYRSRYKSSAVRDLDVFGLVELARKAGLCTGVVFDPPPESTGLDREVKRLKEKVARGAQFAVTQPVYTIEEAEALAEAAAGAGIPLILGILPLRTARHAEFLHEKVSGITVAEPVRRRMHEAGDPVGEGVRLSRELLRDSASLFSGACLMPPFGHYEVMVDILEGFGEC